MAQKTIIAFVCSLFFVTHTSLAQESITSLVEKKKWHSLSNKEDKAKAIFDWICTNISYDVGRLYEYRDEAEYHSFAAQTLTSRRGVCLGYAVLYKSMCDELGIPSFLVEGMARNVLNPSDIGPHAWVVIRTEEGWHIVDPTWGAGTVDRGIFSFAFNDRHFFPPSSTYIETHYPFDPVFQLRSNPCTYEEFVNEDYDSGEYKLSYNEILDNMYMKEEYISLERAWKYYPNDPYLTHNYAVMLMDRSGEYIFPCVEAFNQDNNIEDLPSDCKKNIDISIKNLKQAKSLMKTVLENTDQYTDMVRLNLNVIDQNLNTATTLLGMIE